MDFALAQQEKIWTNPSLPLRGKILAVIELNRVRYRFNRNGQGFNPWSLIGRLRLDTDVLSPRGKEALRYLGSELYKYITIAIEQAIANGEIEDRPPVRDAAFLLSNIVNSSSVFSQEAGSFDTLKQFYHSFSRFLFGSHGVKTPNV